MRPAGTILLVVLFAVCLMSVAVLPFLDVRSPQAGPPPRHHASDAARLLERCLDRVADKMQSGAWPAEGHVKLGGQEPWDIVVVDDGRCLGRQVAFEAEGQRFARVEVMAVAPSKPDLAQAWVTAKARVAAEVVFAGSAVEAQEGASGGLAPVHRRAIFR